MNRGAIAAVESHILNRAELQGRHERVIVVGELAQVSILERVYLTGRYIVAGQQNCVSVGARQPGGYRQALWESLDGVTVDVDGDRVGDGVVLNGGGDRCRAFVEDVRRDSSIERACEDLGLTPTA